MTCASGEIEKERFLHIYCPKVTDVFDGTISEISTEVIALLDRCRWPHRVIVTVESRIELMRLTSMKSIPAIKTSAKRPRFSRSRHVGLIFGSQVPLANGIRRVTALTKNLGEKAIFLWGLSPVARKSNSQVCDSTHSVAMMISSSQQTSTSRRAQCGCVEIPQSKALSCETIDDWCCNV
ncbi:unannotated protein [freshwater metagenome]|uniref:Unannotated protein n=1 Tax=freshwater metagenome TaxID=449393 RepID=A0A6J7AKL0_9ZZZZ